MSEPLIWGTGRKNLIRHEDARGFGSRLPYHYHSTGKQMGAAVKFIGFCLLVTAVWVVIALSFTK